MHKYLLYGLLLSFSLSALLPACTDNNSEQIEKIYAEAIILYNSNQIKKAKSKLLAIIEMDADFHSAYIMLGKIEYYEQNFSDAESRFNDATQIFPESIDALYWRSRARFMQQNTDKDDSALADINALLSRDSMHIDAWILKGQILERRKDMDDAVAAYHAALQLESRLSLAHLQLGFIYEKATLPKKADIHFNKVRALTSDIKIRHMIESVIARRN